MPLRKGAQDCVEGFHLLLNYKREQYSLQVFCPIWLSACFGPGCTAMRSYLQGVLLDLQV